MALFMKLAKATLIGSNSLILSRLRASPVHNLCRSCITLLAKANYYTKSLHTASGPLRHGEYEYEDPKSPEDVVNITVVDRDGESQEIKGKVGDNVMYLAHRHDLDIEGACEASLACCTCHVIVQDEYYDKIPEATEEEEDMLDLAPYLTSTSRLSCQIILTKELGGMTVELPRATRNFYVDGHVPQPH